MHQFVSDLTNVHRLQGAPVLRPIHYPFFQELSDTVSIFRLPHLSSVVMRIADDRDSMYRRVRVCGM